MARPAACVYMNSDKQASVGNRAYVFTTLCAGHCVALFRAVFALSRHVHHMASFNDVLASLDSSACAPYCIYCDVLASLARCPYSFHLSPLSPVAQVSDLRGQLSAALGDQSRALQELHARLGERDAQVAALHAQLQEVRWR